MPWVLPSVAFSSCVVQSDRAVPGVSDALAPEDPAPPVDADGLPVGPAAVALPPPGTLGLAEAGALLGTAAADDPLPWEEPKPDAVLELVGPHPAMSIAATAAVDEATAVEISGFRKMWWCVIEHATGYVAASFGERVVRS